MTHVWKCFLAHNTWGSCQVALVQNPLDRVWDKVEAVVLELPLWVGM